MKYNPLKQNNKAGIMSALCSIAAIVLFVSSAFVSGFGVLYQITAIILAVFSLQVYTKYIVCDYVYEACKNDLKIYKVNGKKTVCVASLAYAESKSNVLKLTEYNSLKNSLPKHKYTVNFAKNLYPNEYCIYLFEFNGKTVRMKFEPSDTFVAYINKLIDKSVSEKSVTAD